MNLTEFCSCDIVTIKQTATISEAAEMMKLRNVGSLVVTGDGSQASKPIGIVTDRDIVIKAVASNLDTRAIKVKAIVSDSLVVIERDLSLHTAVDVMLKNKVRRLLIVDEMGHPCGFLSATDLVRILSSDAVDNGRQLALLADLFKLQSGTASSHRVHDFTRMI